MKHTPSLMPMLRQETRTTPIDAPPFDPLATDASTVRGRFITLFVTPETLMRDAVITETGALSGLSINGSVCRLTTRFFKSLIALYKMPFATYALFSPLEILQRLATAHQSDELAITIDTVDGEVLGVVNRYNAFPIANRVIEILQDDDRRIGEIGYKAGVVSAELQYPGQWSVQGDGDYEARIRCSVPVDGIGRPEVTLGFWRQVCSNGAVAWHSAFTSKIEIEDKTGNHFGRILASFDNQEGFSQIQGKIAAANATFASVREFMLLDNLLTNQVGDAANRVRLQDRLQDIAGNPCVAYGVTALSNIGTKKRALLPVKCSIGDLVNFSTELVTHHREHIKDPAPHRPHAPRLQDDRELLRHPAAHQRALPLALPRAHAAALRLAHRRRSLVSLARTLGEECGLLRDHPRMQRVP